MNSTVGGKDEDCECSHPNRRDQDVGDVMFSPPVYKQRYFYISELVKTSMACKFLDMGCAEGKLISHVKMRCPDLEEIVGVDLDEALLHANKYRLRPQLSDFAFKRPKPLRLAFYQGSVTRPDKRLIGFDLIACVELVEHLPVEDVPAFTWSLLGYLKPKKAVVTTPNADFNVLFPNFKGFRHPDHKFEWSQVEFQTWATQAATQYDYNVEFEGIGKGPQGTEILGCCSQAAVFSQKVPELLADTRFVETNDVQRTSKYELISEVSYPFDKDERTKEERLREEIEFLGRTAFRRISERDAQDQEEDAISEDGAYRCISLANLHCFSRIHSLCPRIEELRECISLVFTFDADKDEVMIPVGHRSCTYSDSCSDSDVETNEGSGYEFSSVTCASEEEESWD